MTGEIKGLIKKTIIYKYAGFDDWESMQNFIKMEWDNRPQPIIKGHGYNKEAKEIVKKDYYEVEVFTVLINGVRAFTEEDLE